MKCPKVDGSACWRADPSWSGYRIPRSGALAVVVSATLLLALTSCMGYVPGGKIYWDSRVDELCRKDGGVTVYETVTLRKSDYERLSQLLSVEVTSSTRSTNSARPYIVHVTQTTIRERDPEVGRSETKVIRRSDSRVLGQAVQYWRRGGGLPTGISEASTYACPESSNLTSHVFKTQGDQ